MVLPSSAVSIQLESDCASDQATFRVVARNIAGISHFHVRVSSNPSFVRILAMDRRRSSTRPASSEGKFPRLLPESIMHLVHQTEIEYWSHASKSLGTLSSIYANPTSIETIGRVNRLMAMWPTDDSLPAESYETLKTNYKRLSSALKEVRRNSEEEIE